MEMPIWAIITLFIAVAVASMVLMFSSEWIGNAGESLWSVFDQGEESKFLNQPTISNAGIARLVDKCHEASYGRALGYETCFSVTLDNAVKIEEAAIKSLVSIDSNKVSIRDGETTTFTVNWNFVDSTVEVKT